MIRAVCLCLALAGMLALFVFVPKKSAEDVSPSEEEPAVAQDNSAAKKPEVAARSDTPPAAPRAVPRRDSRPEEPEDVARQFLISVMLQDSELLRQTAMPTPQEELDWLLAGSMPPAGVQDQIREHFAKLPMKRLQVGDVVPLPQGGELVLDANYVNANCMQLQSTDRETGPFPVPMIMVRIDGRWYVNPRPIIAARKAAFASRKARESAVR